MTPRTEADERALVETLAAAMREKLALNRHKGSWRDETTEYLLRRLYQEASELREAIRDSEDHAAVLAEAADVACFAAMIADVYADHVRARAQQRREHDARADALLAAAVAQADAVRAEERRRFAANWGRVAKCSACGFTCGALAIGAACRTKRCIGTMREHGYSAPGAHVVLTSEADLMRHSVDNRDGTRTVIAPSVGNATAADGWSRSEHLKTTDRDRLRAPHIGDMWTCDGQTRAVAGVLVVSGEAHIAFADVLEYLPAREWMSRFGWEPERPPETLSPADATRVPVEVGQVRLAPADWTRGTPLSWGVQEERARVEVHGRLYGTGDRWWVVRVGRMPEATIADDVLATWPLVSGDEVSRG